MTDKVRDALVDSIIHDEATVRHYRHLVGVYKDEDLKNGANGLAEDAEQALAKHREEFKQRYPNLDLTMAIQQRMVQAKTVMI